MKPANIRALARKLWEEGVPAPDIASLCGMSRSMLFVWRTRDRWPPRRVGRSSPQWEALYRPRRCA